MSRLRVRRLAYLLAIILAVTGGMEIYTRVPHGDIELPIPPTSPDLQRLVLVFHGSQDGQNPQFEEISAHMRERYAGEIGTEAHYLRWDPWSDDRLRAGANALRIGAGLGEALAGMAVLDHLVLIAHSSGAYIPDRLCEALRAGQDPPPRIEMIFLDAFQIRGFVDWTHGARTHGRCADFALSIYNTDDPAPASNRPLRNAFNIDVTLHPLRAGFGRNGHYWPIGYFLRVLLEPDFLPARPDHRSWPRGVSVEAPSAEGFPQPWSND